MKLIITLLSSMILMVGLVSEAQAKRLGSGGFGKVFPSTPAKTAPAPQKQTPQQATPANSPTKGSMMPGILGGLLAGGLFAWLLGSGAFEGLQLMDILLFAVVAFVLFRLLRRPAAQNQQRAAYAGPQQSQDSSRNDAMAFTAQNATGSAATDLPDNFDAEAFLAGALEHYRLVQQAWNEGNLDLIREYVSPAIYEALAAQRNRLMVPPQTEILDLEASIVHAAQNGLIREISILFRGRCKDELERSEDGIFDTWHLERDTSVADAPWIVVGIEAE